MALLPQPGTLITQAGSGEVKRPVLSQIGVLGLASHMKLVPGSPALYFFWSLLVFLLHHLATVPYLSFLGPWNSFPVGFLQMSPMSSTTATAGSE